MTPNEQFRSGTNRPGVLFVSANGIGQGHLTRQLAVARKLTYRRAFFLTMSYSTRIVRDLGLPVQFVPHHNMTGEDPAEWNQNLCRELALLVGHAGIDTIVYDVNFVFDGIIDFLQTNPRLNAIWIRRALWPDHHSSYLGAAAHFQTVFEPSDLAEEFDAGPTVSLRDQVIRVPPVMLLAPNERLDRKMARVELGLPEEAIVVMVEIAGANTVEFSAMRRRIVSLLLANPDVHILEIVSDLADAETALETVSVCHSLRTIHPAFRYSKAWDAAIVRAGYNTFHECLFGHVPVAFVPNEAPDMDGQLARACFAADKGCALMIRLSDSQSSANATIGRLLDPVVRRALAENCAVLTGPTEDWRNGSSAIAGVIDAFGS